MKYKNVLIKSKQVFLGLVTNVLQLSLGKLVAWGYGPSGIILYNNLKQLIQIFSVFITFNAENIVTIQVKKGGFNKYNFKSIINFYKKTFFISLFLIVLILKINDDLRPKILNDGLNGFYFVLALILFALNTLFFSTLNGLDRLIAAYRNQILGTIISLFFLICGLNFAKNKNQLLIYLFLISTSITFILNILTFLKLYFKTKVEEFNLLRVENKNLTFSFLSVAIIFAVYAIGNILQFLLRNKFVEIFLIDKAGLIDSVFTLSNYYTSVIISLFTINSLSELTGINNKIQITLFSNKIVIYGLISISLTTFLMFIFKSNILSLFYSDSFIAINDFYGIVMIGDIFKILLGILMVISFAIKDFKQYFILAMTSNLFTVVPMFFFEFNNVLQLGWFYTISNILTFILSFGLFTYRMKFISFDK